MLEVDLEAHDQTVGQVVAASCGQFGRVASVKLHRNPSAFALVEMTTREQTQELAASYGGSVFGTCALIHLNQRSV